MNPFSLFRRIYAGETTYRDAVAFAIWVGMLSSIICVLVFVLLW